MTPSTHTAAGHGWAGWAGWWRPGSKVRWAQVATAYTYGVCWAATLDALAAVRGGGGQQPCGGLGVPAQ